MISVVIPTYNRLGPLKNCLRSVVASGYNDFEVIVVNDGSTDGTKDFLDRQTHPKLKTIHHLKNLGQSRARNTGIELAGGDIVAFTDDDCVADNGWLTELTAALQDENVGFAFGATYYISRHYKGYFPERLTGNGGGAWPGGANIAFKKGVLKAVGGFDPAFDRYHNEDTELAIRAVAKGFPYARSPGAFVYHQPEKWNAKSLLASAKNLSVWPVLKSKYPLHYLAFGGPAKWRLAVEPLDYIKILLLPILVPILFIRYLYHGKRGMAIFFAKWPVWLLRRRWLVLKEALQCKTFMI